MAKKSRPTPRAKKPDAFQTELLHEIEAIRHALERIADRLDVASQKEPEPDAQGTTDAGL